MRVLASLLCVTCSAPPAPSFSFICTRKSPCPVYVETNPETIGLRSVTESEASHLKLLPNVCFSLQNKGHWEQMTARLPAPALFRTRQSTGCSWGSGSLVPLRRKVLCTRALGFKAWAHPGEASRLMVARAPYLIG